MPKDYQPKDYPERNCIVCGVRFKPFRESHVFSPTPDCWDDLKTKERFLMVQLHQALVRQRYLCHFCNQPLDLVRSPVLLDPSKSVDDIEPIEVVAAHTACRMSYYQELASKSVD